MAYGTDITRVNVGLIAKSARALDALEGMTGLNKTDITNRGIQLLHYVEVLQANGGKVLVRQPNGDIGELHLF